MRREIAGLRLIAWLLSLTIISSATLAVVLVPWVLAAGLLVLMVVSVIYVVGLFVDEFITYR